MEVGIRELRNHLSRYLAAVRDGAQLTVTARGRPVARVVPATGERPLDRLVREGVVIPASRRKRPIAGPPIVADGTVSDLVGDQRR